MEQDSKAGADRLMKSADKWLVLVIILGMIFLFPFWIAKGVRHLLFAGGDEMSRKRAITNWVGLVCLGGFVIAILVSGGSKFFQKNQEIKDTEVLLNFVAEGFSHKDRNVIMQWAEGGYSDVWGNHLILRGNDDGSFRFVSKGPDGVIDTDDDVTGRLHRYEVHEIFKPKPKPRPSKQKNIQKTKTVEDRIDEAKAKAGELFNKAKKAAEDVEVEAEKEKGWKWNFKWRWRGDKDE